MGGDNLVEHVAGAEAERTIGDAVRESEPRHYRELIGEVEPFEGARELIVTLKRRGLGVILASSAKEEELDHYLDLLDARELVDAWTSSEDVERTKPDPDIVHAAIEKGGGGAAIMIGDATWDVIAADRAGVATVCVLTGGFAAAELYEAGAAAVFESIAELGRQVEAGGLGVTRGDVRAPLERPRRAIMGAIEIGCSGWNYKHWRNGVFYPPRLPQADWLAFYAERFDTVEVNTTFYRLPRRELVERWVNETPAGFVFSVKVSRYVTHVKRLQQSREHLDVLLERLEPLVDSGKLGPLLWQLPPTFERDTERLAATLEDLPDGLRHAFEFRHSSWFADEILALLRAHDVALVIADRPEIQSFQTLDLTADFVFVRFHHGSRGKRGNYSDVELDEWAARLREWRRSRDVFAYFNNDWEGFAPANARSAGRDGLRATRKGGRKCAVPIPGLHMGGVGFVFDSLNPCDGSTRWNRGGESYCTKAGNTGSAVSLQRCSMDSDEMRLDRPRRSSSKLARRR